MKIIYLVYYTLFGLLLFFVKNYLKRKDGTINDIVVSLIFLIVMSGVVSVFDLGGINESIYLVIVIEMLLRMFYNFVVEKSSETIDINKFYSDYIITFLLGLVINIVFINRVDSVIPSGESLKNIVWLVIILYVYTVIKGSKISNTNKKSKPLNNIRYNRYIVSNYAKFKQTYHNYIKIKEKNLNTLLYAIMIYEDKSRSSFKRSIDNIFYGKLTKVTKLGIMQMETPVYINDIDSISMACNKLNKIYTSLSRKKKLVEVKDILKEYYKEDTRSTDIIYIYNILIEFNEN